MAWKRAPQLRTPPQPSDPCGQALLPTNLAPPTGLGLPSCPAPRPAPAPQPQVRHAPASRRVHEAMSVDGAPASEASREHSQTLEAELRAAIAAHHLVALRPLRQLLLQVLLRHSHAASWALLRPGLLHPPQQTLLVLFSAAFAHPLSVLLAGKAPVIRLRTATDTGCLLAERALQAPGFPVFQGNSHRAAWSRARTKVGLAGNRLFKAAVEQLVEDLLGQKPPQVMLGHGLAALRAGHVHGAKLQPRLRKLCHAAGTVPAMLATKTDSALRRNILGATDGARLHIAVETHERPARFIAGTTSPGCPRTMPWLRVPAAPGAPKALPARLTRQRMRPPLVARPALG
mmetsp:Transcript_111108/g.309430  ORF Transcript_111108/g.309430 Transcript_111108/m.309430 type:complete len:345 (-) Transcript_111108:420-1454(-)